MGPGDLFIRDAALIIGPIRIASLAGLDASPRLRFSFRITKTTTKEPNKSEIVVYNLSQQNRALLQQKNVQFTLEAGYVGNTHQLFQGDVVYTQSVLDGADWVTKFQAGDAVSQIKTARINIGMKGPVTAQQALSVAAKALGLPLDPPPASLRPNLTSWVNGLTMTGKADMAIDSIARSMGLEWSVQDGKVSFAPPDLIKGRVVVLRPGTGLIGSPEAGEKGAIKVKSLLQPNLVPYGGVQIVSGQIQGLFRIQKATYVGDTWSDDWHAELECKQIS